MGSKPPDCCRTKSRPANDGIGLVEEVENPLVRKYVHISSARDRTMRLEQTTRDFSLQVLQVEVEDVGIFFLVRGDMALGDNLGLHDEH